MMKMGMDERVGNDKMKRKKKKKGKGVFFVGLVIVKSRIVSICWRAYSSM